MRVCCATKTCSVDAVDSFLVEALASGSDAIEGRSPLVGSRKWYRNRVGEERQCCGKDSVSRSGKKCDLIAHDGHNTHVGNLTIKDHSLFRISLFVSFTFTDPLCFTCAWTSNALGEKPSFVS